MGIARILVVEDSSVMQMYYTQILSRMPGCQVAFVRNGHEALLQIERKGSPDVVVLDINMPVMDGLEFLGHFRARRPAPAARVVIVSTEGREDDLRRGMEAGADAYLTKPFQPEALQEVVRSLIATPAATEAEA